MKTHPFISKKIIGPALLSAGILCPLISSATSLQRFSGLSFANPALLTHVKNKQIIVGGSFYADNLRFKGNSTIPGPTTRNGEASSVTRMFSPYFRYAQRVFSRFVVGLDITEPFLADVKYPANSFVRFANFHTRVRTTNFKPTVAFSINKRLSVGAGLDFMYTRALLSSFLLTTSEEYRHWGNGWTIGWHVGLQFRAARGTFIDAAYYSKTNTRIHGQSVTGSSVSAATKATVHLPPTYELAVLQAFSPRWFVKGEVDYTQWNVLKEIAISDTISGNLTPVPFNYKNTWRFALSTHYQWKPKFAVQAHVAYDNSPTNDTDRSLLLPEEDWLTLGGGVEYKLSKALKANVGYAYTFVPGKADINHTTTGSVTSVGNVKVSSSTFLARLTWDM